MLIKIV